MPAASPAEALRAEAVLMRTRTAAVRPAGHSEFLKTDLCDSRHCIVYSGITQENNEARRAVQDTAGGRLYRAGAVAPVTQHISCGWSGEQSGEDRAAPAGMVRSASDLERLTHGYPSGDLFCESSSLIQPAWSRWVRIVDADLLRGRIEREKYIGAIERVQVLGRTPTGRVTGLEVAGVRASVRLEGVQALERALDPGGLRSTLFTVQPLYDGRHIRWLVLWGAGTGDGQGMCLAGALGQAHLGGRYRAILSRYFPGTEVRGAPPEPKAPPTYRPLGPGPTVHERERARLRSKARAREKARAALLRKKAAAKKPAQAASVSTETVKPGEAETAPVEGSQDSGEAPASPQEENP